MILFGYGSIPIHTIFRGMNIHLPAILGFTRYQGFDPSPHDSISGWTKQMFFVTKGSQDLDFSEVSVDSTHMLIIVYQYPQMAALLPMRSMTSDLRQRSFHKQIKNDKQSWWNCRTAHIQPLKWMAEGRENPWNAHFRKVLRLQVVVIHFSWKPW